MAAVMQWQKLWKRVWNGDGKTSATGKVEVAVTESAQAFIGGDGNAVVKMVAARMEWQRKNGGDGSGRRISDGIKTGFAWQ